MLPLQNQIVIVDDDVDTGGMVADGLLARGFDAIAVTSAEACMEHLRTHTTDLVVTDVWMTGLSGIELCTRIKREHPETLAIVVTGSMNLDTAVDAIRAGAYDYITKPVKAEAVAIAVHRALDHVSLKRELRSLRAAAARALPAHGIAGESPAIRDTIEMVERVADSDATVLITGASGTGKELVARALHRLSSRRDQPFVAINCAAMPAALLESELFGHVRGAFTDAKTSRQGLFLQAGTGTIFLDEIGEMPMEMQVKLLRVLQERVVRPVGGDEELPIRARVVTATNRDLEVEIEAKRFREDLYYRINVVPIALPSLSARDTDILLLAQLFLGQSAAQCKKAVDSISESAARKLLEYDWPGNVRELENCIARAVALCRHSEITIDDLPPAVSDHNAATIVVAATSPLDMITLDELGQRYARQVLDAAKGNKTQAAKILGIDRRSLYRMVGPKSTDAPVEAVELS